MIKRAHKVFSTKVVEFHISQDEIMHLLICNTSGIYRLSFSVRYNIGNQRTRNFAAGNTI